MAIRLVYTMPVGNYTYNEYEVDGPASYVNPGGQVITAAQLGLSRITNAAVAGHGIDSNGATPNRRQITPYLRRDRAQQGAEALTLIWATTGVGGTEVANAVNLSTFQARICVMGPGH